MPRRTHAILATLTLAALAACAEPTAPVQRTAAPSHPQFASAGGKFSFQDVTFPDETTGIIEAGTKATRKGTFTQCSYFAPAYAAYLGGYGDDTLPAADVDDAEAVLAFCLAHYADRS